MSMETIPPGRSWTIFCPGYRQAKTTNQVDLARKSGREAASGHAADIALIVCNGLSLLWFIVQFFYLLGR